MNQLDFTTASGDIASADLSAAELRRIDETIKWLEGCRHLRAAEGPNGLGTRSLDALQKLRAAIAIPKETPAPPTPVPGPTVIAFCDVCSTRDRIVTHSFNTLQAERIIYTLQGMLCDAIENPTESWQTAECLKSILAHSWDSEMYAEHTDSAIEARGLDRHANDGAYFETIHETVA